MATLQTRKPALLAAGVILILLVGFLDYITGPELSFSIFYVVPLFFVSFQLGKSVGISLALLSGVLWFAVEQSTGREYSNFLVPYWNTAVRTAFFLLVGVGVPILRKDLQKSVRAVDKLSHLLPLCAWCKRVRDPQGEWHRIEEYIETHSGSEITHGICPICIEQHHTQSSARKMREGPARQVQQPIPGLTNPRT